MMIFFAYLKIKGHCIIKMEKEQKYSKNDCQSKVNMFSWPWRTKERETAEY